MKDEPIIKILKKTKAIITNSHFVYISGKHGSVYINKDATYPHTKEVSRIGKLFAQKFKSKNIDIIAAPALGGIIISQWTAYHLSRLNRKEILAVYTEKNEIKDQLFTRGYDTLLKGKKVLVIEDLTTTGESVRKVVDSVGKAGGKVVAVCVMVNRNPDEVNEKMMGVPFYSLGVFKADAFDEKKCPLCRKHIPINMTVGHGRKYLKSRKTN